MQWTRGLIIALFALPLVANSLNAQISGEGEIVKQEIQLETITGIGLGFNAEVVLTQGSPQKIVLEGQQNILDNIKREVHNGTWHIHYKKNVRNSKGVKVYITMESLDEVALSGSGDIATSNTFRNLGDLDVAISGSGDIDLKFEARDVEVAVSGSGDVILGGSGRTIEIAISGSGDVDARELKTERCEVAISGSGDANVYCTESLEVAISGSGDVGYRGNAPKVEASVHGSGDVREID